MLFKSKKKISITFIVFFILNVINIYAYSHEKITVRIEIVRAFDYRLPVLSDKDMKQILNEAKRMISIKFGDKIEIDFRDNGAISLADLFIDCQYRSSKFYKELNYWKYDLNNPPDLNKDEYKKHIIEFLKQWELSSLKSFFPDKQITSYDDFYRYLTATYHRKIEWLRTLKTKDGISLILQPVVPFQSYVEWLSYMWYQDKYDVVFTNTLILYDLFSEPYPHSICKHSKVGGSSFLSPKRKPLDERSLMVNVFEEYGNIKEICRIDVKTPGVVRNKILGGFYFAHEFAHTFYLIPDVYDHGDTCLMNTTLSCMDNLKSYNLLISDLSQCQKCQPWIIAKEYVIRAQNAYEKKDYIYSGEMYMEAASKTPKIIDGNYRSYVIMLYEKALNAYKKAKDRNNIKKCKELIKKTKSKLSLFNVSQ